MSSRHRMYREYLKEALKNRKDALEYLKAAMEDEDPRVFLIALNHVIEALGITKSELARKTGLSREYLYRGLSLAGNPRWDTMRKVLAAIGFKLEVGAGGRLKKAS